MQAGCVLKYAMGECGATAVPQISTHLLVTESLKLAHLIKHNAHGQTPCTPFTLITQSVAHTLAHANANTQSHKAKLSVLIEASFGVGLCMCVVLESIIRRVITTLKHRRIFTKSRAAVNGVTLCFTISANLPLLFFLSLSQFSKIAQTI